MPYPSNRIPFLDWPSLEKLARESPEIFAAIASLRRQVRSYSNDLDDAAGGTVATTNVIIPRRSNDIPGGPVKVQPKRYDTATDTIVDDGPEVDVLSWVKADSADPAGQAGGVLWIFITQDPRGVYWFTAQDCTSPPCAVYNQTGQAVDPIPQAPSSASSGLGFTVTAAGVFAMTGTLTYDLSLVGNNTDIGVRAQALVDGVPYGNGIDMWLFRSSGAVVNQNFTIYFEFTVANIGTTVDIHVSELSSNGTLILSEAFAQYMGPIK